jgi:hypothetical protein
MISRLHAIILEEIVNGVKQYKIVDNNSINGVIVNGIRVKEAILTYDLDCVPYSIPFQKLNCSFERFVRFLSFREGDLIVFGGCGPTPIGKPVTRPLSELVYVFHDPQPHNLSISNQTAEFGTNDRSVHIISDNIKE